MNLNSLARKHHVGGRFRSFNRWTQFMALLVGQLFGRKTLCDLVVNFAVQGHKLYHLGMKKVPRTTLARVNEEQLHELYKELLHKMLGAARPWPRKIASNWTRRFSCLMPLSSG